MRLSIIVVHHDAPEDLKVCLRSVEKAAEGLSFETIVVDNASENAGSLQAQFPAVTWLQNDTNVGFGSAINQGAAESGGDILVVLNADVELLPDSLRSLDRFFAEKEGLSAGTVGGKLLFPDGRIQPSCGPFPTLFGLLWRRALPPVKRKYYLRSPDSAAPVDWVTGAFFAVRHSVLREIGGFDPGFFLYYEDADFCLRARLMGHPTYFLPAAAAYHRHPYAVRAKPDPQLKKIIQTSRLLYFAKHRPAWEVWALKGLQLLER